MRATALQLLHLTSTLRKIVGSRPPDSRRRSARPNVTDNSATTKKPAGRLLGCRGPTKSGHDCPPNGHSSWPGLRPDHGTLQTPSVLGAQDGTSDGVMVRVLRSVPCSAKPATQGEAESRSSIEQVVSSHSLWPPCFSRGTLCRTFPRGTWPLGFRCGGESVRYDPGRQSPLARDRPVVVSTLRGGGATWSMARWPGQRGA